MSLADIEVGDLFAHGKTHPIGGMGSPYPRRLFVNPDGNGDYTTATAAIAYAQSQQTGAYERWTIHLACDILTENLDVTRGIHVVGSAFLGTRINGNTRLHSGGSIHNCGLMATSGNYGLECVLDADAVFCHAINCYILHSHGLNQKAIAVNVTGTAVLALPQLMGCYLYAQASANHASAIAVGYHLSPGVVSPIESFGGHCKTSSRALGSAWMGWNEGTGADAYIHAEQPWIPARFDGAAIYECVNTNASAPYGGMLWTGDVQGDASTLVSNPANSSATAVLRRLKVAGLWDAPVELGASGRLWQDATGAMRTKTTTPTGDTDGIRLAPNPTDAGYTNVDVYQSTASVAVAGGGGVQVVVFNAETTDQRAEYNNSTGVFTAQQAGTYMVQTALYRSDTATGRTTAYIYKNGANAAAVAAAKPSTETVTVTAARTMVLAVGDTIDVRVAMTNAGTLGGGSHLTWLRIVRVF